MHVTAELRAYGFFKGVLETIKHSNTPAHNTLIFRWHQTNINPSKDLSDKTK